MQRRRSTKRTSHPNHKMLRKNILNYLLSNPTFSSFLIHFEQSKKLWVCQLKNLQNLFQLEAMEQYPRILSSTSQIVLSHPSLNTNPSYFKTSYLPHFCLFFSDLHGYECAKWLVEIPFWTQVATKECQWILRFLVY